MCLEEGQRSTEADITAVTTTIEPADQSCHLECNNRALNYFGQYDN